MNFDDGVDSTTVRSSQAHLAQIIPGDDPGKIIDALAPSLGVAAGLLILVNGQTMSMTQTSLRLPPPIFEGWMHTQPENLRTSLYPALRSSPGDFWSDRDGLPDKLRSNIEVLHLLHQYGLGEGAGLKLVKQPLPDGQIEHVVLALLTERGTRFPVNAAEIGVDLAPAAGEAIARLQLPFTVGRSIHAQMLDEDETGFVCLGDGRTNGHIIELNQRAYELAREYAEPAGLECGRFSMHDFVEKALAKNARTTLWQLAHPKRRSVLQVRAHVLPGKRFGYVRDLPVLKLQEWNLQPSPSTGDNAQVFLLPEAFKCLTKREREIVALMLGKGLSSQEIASELEPAIELKTVRKHTENIHRKLAVRSTAELIALYLKHRN